jgi:transcriptional regulator with PAS, ATPase and Fis domain
MGESVSQTYFVGNDVSEPEAEVVTSLGLNGNWKTVGSFGGIIGQSKAWRGIIEQIEIVAPTAATVLILGETGTGKELLARELHWHSRRRHNPLVRVNCACIPKELYESEFFGHAKGAFTGAIKDRLDVSRQLLGEPCFWTRLAKCLWRCRANCCVFCRTNVTNA